MEGVRFIAGAFLLPGVASSRRGRPRVPRYHHSHQQLDGASSSVLTLASAAMPLVTTLLAALGPFFLWALLSALIAIHEQLVATRRAKERPERR